MIPPSCSGNPRAFRAAPLDALSAVSVSKPPPLVDDGIEQAVFWRLHRRPQLSSCRSEGTTNSRFCGRAAHEARIGRGHPTLRCEEITVLRRKWLPPRLPERRTDARTAVSFSRPRTQRARIPGRTPAPKQIEATRPSESLRRARFWPRPPRMLGFSVPITYKA